MTNKNTKLLTVEDTFLIESRGVMLMPVITDYCGPMSFLATLRKPDGAEISAQAHLDILRVNSAREPYPFACSLVGLSKQDVPIGTEIWISHKPVA